MNLQKNTGELFCCPGHYFSDTDSGTSYMEPGFAHGFWSQQIIEYGVNYMNIYALGTIFVELTLGMNAFITAQGFAKTGMMSVLIGAVANIIFGPDFYFRI